MALANIQLTQKDIFEKNFKTGMRGYNQDEVDEYLDKIIQDYETFKKEIDRLKSENERLRQQQSSNETVRSSRSVQQPKEQAPQPAAPVRERESQTNHQVNYDILKRLSNLEKAVFGKKFAENDV